jgi:pimeloyl-ACP methyl ester carboxylesterase
MTTTSEVSAYDRMVWPEGEVERWLVSGEHRRELLAYFGEAEYFMLRRLAIAAAAVPADPERCVLFVPGLMGSLLAQPRDRPQPDNLLWLDPNDIQQGHLSLLTMPGAQLVASGPVLYGYLPLKLVLQAAGYTVRCFAYDWRRDLADSGLVLSRVIAATRAREISVVAHSMGGLVARYALTTEAGQRVQRLITLGTPHGGSFAPVQAVRGVYPLVRRLAQIDPHHLPEVLARDVFSSFHSLYQMLPLDSALDLINSRSWPRIGPQPNATLLDRVPMLRLGGPDARINALAGYGFQTPVHIACVEEDFYYRYESAGDGTVPTARAVLPGCEAWFCNVPHGELARSPLVHEAVLKLLADEAPQLPGAPPPALDPPTSASDTELRQVLNEKIDWTRLDSTQRRAFLDSLNRPPPAGR